MVQTVINGHKNPNYSQHYYDGLNDEITFYSIKEIVTKAPNDTQHQNNAHPKTILIDCNGVLLANVQCRRVPIFILWYREY